MSPGAALFWTVVVLIVAFVVFIFCVFRKERPATIAHHQALHAIEVALEGIFPKLSLHIQETDTLNRALLKFGELCLKFRYAEKQKGLYAREQSLEQCQALLKELESLVMALSVSGERPADT